MKTMPKHLSLLSAIFGALGASSLFKSAPKDKRDVNIHPMITSSYADIQAHNRKVMLAKSERFENRWALRRDIAHKLGHANVPQIKTSYLLKALALKMQHSMTAKHNAT